MKTEYGAYIPVDFEKVADQATQLANLIENEYEKVVNVLLEYESYEVAEDEIARTLDLLKNLYENKDFFQLRVGQVAAFLPRNQPLYAFCCFVVVPSLMAESVHFRIPQSMRRFFPKLLALLRIQTLFPNITVSEKQRIDFLKERSAIYVDKNSEVIKPLTDVVIFTGTSAHADHLRAVFDSKTLFITNGSGHNPVIVSKGADLKKAANAVMMLQFYNQGQDCAAPNSILVHKDIHDDFLELIRQKIKKLKVGNYTDKNCQIGPISDPKDLVRIQDIIISNRSWLDRSTPGIIRSSESIVEPVMICKPLSDGGNFNEVFAPIMFLQRYDTDQELKKYFEDERYAPNAMYLTLYGRSKYVDSLLDKKIKGRVIHPKDSLIHNTHLHAEGVERGTQPYGGYSHGASNISIDGNIIPMPTLPQRDIYLHVAKSILDKNLISTYQLIVKNGYKLKEKNVDKILKFLDLKNTKGESSHENDHVYVDLHSNGHIESRYKKIKKEDIYYLLKNKNTKYIHKLELKDKIMLKRLKRLLLKKKDLTVEVFGIALYNIPRLKSLNDEQNKERQLLFFKHTYHLLFGEDHGPHLGPFLWNVERELLDKLLEV